MSLKKKQKIKFETNRKEILVNNQFLLQAVKHRRDNEKEITSFKNVTISDINCRPPFIKMERSNSMDCTRVAVNNLVPTSLTVKQFNVMADYYFVMLASRELNQQNRDSNVEPQPLKVAYVNAFIKFDPDSNGYHISGSKNWGVDVVGYINEVTKDPKIKKFNVSMVLKNNFRDYTTEGFLFAFQ